MDLLSLFYITLPTFNTELILHVSKLVFNCVVLGLIIMFLLSCSSKWLTVVVLKKKGKA